MKLNISKNPEDVKVLVGLMKAVSQSGAAGEEAREAVAAFVGPVISQALDQMATHRMFYKKWSYNLGQTPSIPLDLFESNEEGLFDIWTSSNTEGGLATNHVQGGEEFRVSTFTLESAFNLFRRNADEGRFDILVKSIERMAQEVMVKEKYQAWNVILRALAGARTGGQTHLIDATAPGVLQYDDFNRLKTKATRLRNSWIGGTPLQTVGQGYTHIVLSPEMMEQVRAMSYQPGNTRAGSEGATETSNTSIALPEAVRLRIFESAGLAEIPGIGKLVELREMGVDQSYNNLFDSVYSPGVDDPTFDEDAQQIVLAVDVSVDAGVQVVATDSDRSTEFFMEEDDQFTKRSGKVGWFGKMETGFAWMDNKATLGIIV